MTSQPKAWIAAGVIVGMGLLGGLEARATQLGILLDSSGSISNSDFEILRTGFANAASQFTTDGSLEVSIFQFGSSANVVLAPLRINSPGDISTVVNAINGIDRSAAGSLTNYEAAFNLAASTIDFSLPESQIINMLTDGVPSTDDTPGRSSSDSAVAARDNLISAGADVISFEAIGVSSTALDFLKDELAFPQPGVLAPPFPDPITDNGFVTPVDTFGEVETALLSKFTAVGAIDDPTVDPPVTGTVIPTPGAALAGFVLLGVTAMRRRSNTA